MELEEPGGMIMYELKSHTAFQGEAEQRVTKETAGCWRDGSKNPIAATFNLCSDLQLLGTSFPQFRMLIRQVSFSALHLPTHTQFIF